MQIAFTLSMPGSPSWNGKWSGENTLYARVRCVVGKKNIAGLAHLLAKRVFTYGWSDGWRASVEMREASRAEAAQIRRKSRGFQGYDWMIDSILRNGYIIAPSDEAKQKEA